MHTIVKHSDEQFHIVDRIPNYCDIVEPVNENVLITAIEVVTNTDVTSDLIELSINDPNITRDYHYYIKNGIDGNTYKINTKINALSEGRALVFDFEKILQIDNNIVTKYIEKKSGQTMTIAVNFEFPITSKDVFCSTPEIILDSLIDDKSIKIVIQGGIQGENYLIKVLGTSSGIYMNLSDVIEKTVVNILLIVK